MSAPGPHDARLLRSTASTTAALSALLLQQQQDFAEGQRRRVEDYLADRPTLAGDASAVRRLVLNEALLRYEAGEDLSPEEYERRFPALADQLPAIFFLLSAAGSRPPPSDAERAVSTRLAPADGQPVDLLPPTLRVPPPRSAGAGPADWPRVEGYTILGTLGRGGMGVVYKARQERLGRVVALKRVRAADPAPEQLARFLDEARRSAALEHPNIVRLYEAGEQEGRPYFTMEFVDGPSLHDHLAGAPQDPAAAAALVEVLARAIHYAHGKGIVHRDLKPGNVLLAAGGLAEGAKPQAAFVPKVADFGLAKTLDPDALQTATGEILGTPAYMAPEQADGRSRDIGPATDTYALGAILYECLTGRPPFLATKTAQMLELVRTCEPVSPRALQPDVPRDLETICLACLEKDPRRRYPSAEALADDLRRYLDGKPILRRPLRWWGRALKYARRHPARAGVMATSAAAVVLGSTLGALTWVRGEVIQQQSRQIEGNKQELVELGQAIYSATEEAHSAKEQATQARQEKDQAVVERLTAQGWAAFVRGRYAEAKRCVTALEPEVGSPDRRPFEVRHLARLCAPAAETLSAGAGPFDWSALSPGGARAAFAGPESLIVYEAGTHTARPSRDGPAWAIAFAPDGKRLALVAPGSRVAILSEPFVGQGKMLPQTPPFGDKGQAAVKLPAPFPTLAWAPGGQSLAVVADNAGLVVWLWRVETGDWQEFSVHLHAVRRLAWSPDGARLATGDGGGTVQVWDVATRLPVLTLAAHKGPVTALGFSSHNGGTLLTGGEDGTARLWDLNGQPLRVCPDHVGPVGAVAFSPAGTLITADADVLRAWDARGPRAPAPHGHPGGVGALEFLAGGTHFRTTGSDGTVKLWEVASLGNPARPELPPPKGNGGRPCLAFSPDGSLLATGNGGDVVLFDVARRTIVGTLVGGGGSMDAVAFSPDGKRLATGGQDRTVQVWDLTVEKPPLPPAWKGHEAQVTALAFSPDGRLLASAGLDGDVLLWDPDGAGAPLKRLPQGRPVWAVAFSPDGEALAAGIRGKQGGTVVLWDLAHAGAPERFDTRVLHQGEVRALAFAPPGPDRRRLLASASSDGTVVAWDVGRAEPFALERKHPSRVWGLAFAPDGTLAAAGDDDLVLWDVETRKERFAFLPPGKGFPAPAFSSDPRHLAVRAQDGLTLWEAVPVRKPD